MGCAYCEGVWGDAVTRNPLMEESLRAHAEEFCRLQRLDCHGSTRQVAYAVVGPVTSIGSESELATQRDDLVRLARIPRTSAGEPDWAELQALPVVSTELLAACERLLGSASGVRECAILPSQWMAPERLLHLEQVLPQDLLNRPAAPADNSAPSLSSPRSSNNLPWALAQGPDQVRPDQPATLVELLLQAAQRSRADDIRYRSVDGATREQSLSELLESARKILGGLRAHGLIAGCRVVLQLESNIDILAAFWACILGGCPPVIVPIPPSYTEPSRGLDQLAHIVQTLDQPWIVHSQQHAAPLEQWLKQNELTVGGSLEIERLSDHPGAQEIHQPQPEDVAFFSTSSGSTGHPKCVQLTHRGLLARAHGTNQLCGHSAEEVILNWLPLDHIGSISDWHLRCVLLGCRMVYVPKEYVISQPLRWLDLIDQYRITHSWAPNFAYSLIRDALTKQDAAAVKDRWDLSCVIGLLTAGEAVSPKVVAEFLTQLQPFGFAETAIRPAFGMAELGSGVTYFIPSTERPLRFHTIARSTLETGPVRVGQDHPEAITFTDLGGPIPGIAIRIVDAERQILREETVGQVQIRGAAVMAGYYRNPAANAVLLDDGWFDTGDLGFLTEGQLVLTGRAKDVIIVNGANYYCGEIEEVVESVPGVEPSFTAACAPRRNDREELVLFFCANKTMSESELAKLITRIRQAVVRQIGINPEYVLPVEQTQIPKTAIGKLQRSQLAKQFEAGQFDGLSRNIDLLTRSSRTISNWFFRRHWQPATLLDGAHRRSDVTALLGDSVLLDALADGLRSDGTRVVRVEIGDSFSDLAADHFRINPAEPGDIETLLESCLWQDLLVDRWIVGYAGCLMTDALSPAESQRQLSLVQALVQTLASRNEAAQDISLTVLSRNAEAMTAADAPEIEHAAVRGWLRSAGHEFSWLNCRWIDFDKASSSEATAERLLREMAAFPGEREVVLRDGDRYLPRLERVTFDHPPTALPLPLNAAYVIAGPKTEFRDILAEFLTDRWGARLTILEDSGGQAKPQASVDGVFYIPGTLPEAGLNDPATRDAANRLANEVLAWHDWLQDRPETLFISIASMDALMGGRGRSGEAGPLLLLDACNRRRQLSGKTFSLWVEPATEENQSRAQVLRAGGYQDVGPDAWLKSVLAALAHGETECVIGLDGQNPYVRRLTTNDDPLVEHLTAFYSADDSLDAAQLAVIEWPVDPFGSPLNLAWAPLDELPRDDQGEIDRTRLRRGVLHAQEASAAPATEIEQQVARIFRDALGLSSIGLNDNFFELGGHSILLMQVHAKLQDVFGPKLQLVDMFKYPSVAALAKALGDDQPAKTDSGESFGRQRAEVRRQVRHGEGSEPAVSGVAVIGMACRFPGANTVEEFWQNLRNGVESISFFTEAEALAAGIDPARVRHPDFVKAAPIIPFIEDFDADFFGYTPKEARLMDPQQRVFLECAWEAMEEAGYNPRTCPLSVGIFAGAVMNTYLVNNLVPNRSFIDADDHSEVFTLDSMAGFQFMVANDKDYLTTRISYKLNLRGPSVNVQTACSTSLVAVHLAAQAVLNGECDMALAGGVSVKVPQDTGYLYQSDVIVSPDGHCRAFDANAQGTIFGNGSGAVLLKRVEDAIQDGDQIYAVIRGSAFNNDGGNKLGYMAPSQEGQAAVVAEALAVAGVPPETVRFIEAHGTGTSLGDPIEIAGLKQGLGTSDRGFCAVGSVKTNLGHLQIASGIAGFMKAVLAVHHGEIPPTLHFETPNPRIKFDQTPFFVNNRLLPWPAGDHPRRAGVNSLGIGGANCHVILEQPPAPQVTVDSAVRPRHLLQLSGQNEAALRDLTRRYLDWLAAHPQADLADVCYTANVGRVPLPHRLAMTASSVDDLRQQLQTRWNDVESPLGIIAGAGPIPRVAFLFTGQGSQASGMARRLFETQPTFRRALEECAGLVDGQLPKPLLSVLYNEPSDDAIHQTGFAQVALFAVEYALAQLWLSWGVRPAVMIGHSLGEYVAACVAGVFSLADALKLVGTRGRLMQALPAGGGMAAVGLSVAEAEQRLASIGNQVGIAAMNAPHQVVLSGDLAALEPLLEELIKDGVTVHRLKVSHAFHSARMEPMLAEFRRTLNEISWHKPRLPVISNLTGSLADEELAAAEYWLRHLREPVRFRQGMETLGSLADVCLEVGPQPLLTNLGRQCLSERPDSAWLTSLRTGHDDWQTLLDSLTALSLSGVEVDWSGFDRDYTRRRISLPTYPFQRKRFWIERPRGNAAAALPTQPAVRGTHRHPLLQQRWRSPMVAETVFECRLSLAELPFLADHQFCGTVIAPATGFLVMALSAAQEIFGSGAVCLTNVNISEALPLDARVPQRVQLIASKAEADHAAFQLISLAEESETTNSADFRLHARGELGRAVAPANSTTNLPTLDAILAKCPHRLTREEFYQSISTHDVVMGDLFQSVDECWAGEHELWGRVRIAPGLGDLSAYAVHPSVLDACLQLMPGGIAYDAALSFIPVGVDRLEFFASPQGIELWCRSVPRPQADAGGTQFTVDTALFDAAGRLCVQLIGLHYQRLPKAALRKRIRREATHILYETAWRPQPLAATPSDRESAKRWLILADKGGFGQAVSDRLEHAGHECVLAFAGEQYRRKDGGHFHLRGDDRADWNRLLKDTAGVGFQPFDGIVYLWGLDRRSRNTAEEVVGSLQHGCGSLLQLIQSMLREEWDAAPPLTIVTRGSQACGLAAKNLDVAAASLWGFGRTMDLEHPAWTCRRVDLSPEAEDGEIERLIAELLAGYDEREIAFRNSDRLTPRIVRLQHRESASLAVRPDRSYLITGGGGALGLKTAQWLIDQGARHLVLVNRSGLNESAQTLAANWQSLGVHVLAACCDTACEEELARVFAEIDASLPALAGIVHAAGILDDGSVDRLDWPRFQGVLAPKALGAWHLHRLTEHRTLDFFVCFSSIAAGLGSPGQANYAAANAFLDGLAQMRQADGKRSLSVQWGPWANGGMAAKLAESVRQQHQRRGLEPLEDAAAFEALSDLLRGETAQAMVAAIDWSLYRQHLPDGQPQPLLDVVAPFTPRVNTEQSAFRREWDASSPLERQQLVSQLTRKLVSRAVGFDEVSAEDSFFDLGLDSLSSVQLRNDLQEFLDVELSSTLAFSYPTLNQLNSFLTQDVLDINIGRPLPHQNGQAQAVQGHAEQRHEEMERTEHAGNGVGVAEAQQTGTEALSEAELADQLSRMLAAMQTESAS